MGCWSHSPIGWPSGCASTTASTRRTRSCCATRCHGSSGGSLVVFVVSRMYGKWWRYVGRATCSSSLRSVVLVTLGLVAAVAVLHPVTRARRPRARSPWACRRASSRCLPAHRDRPAVRGPPARADAPRAPARLPRARRRAHVLIVGAGDGGRLVLREILRNRDLGLNPVGFVDDDPTKRRVRDRRRARPRQHAGGARRASSTRSSPTRSSSRSRRRRARCAARVVRRVPRPRHPGPHAADRLRAAAGAAASTSCARCARSQVEDVLGREPVRMELDRVGALPRRRGRAGHRRRRLDRRGAVPPDRARRAAQADPARPRRGQPLPIQRELEDDRHVHPSTLAAVLADCKEEERMREVFAEHRPTVVFHAAAYKHVGPDGAQPGRGRAQQRARDARDGAAWPASSGVRHVRARLDRQGGHAGDRDGRVEGAGRVGGRGGRARASRRRATRPCASATCSARRARVVPIFRRQIATGGPVTVTDERMTRYFMTIPEAVQLIIRSGSLAHGRRGLRARDGRAGVGSCELARDMIELSGLRARTATSRSRSSGAAPGEKLHEELFNPLRAPAADAGREDPARRARAARPGGVEAMFDRDRPARARGRRGRPGARRCPSSRRCRRPPVDGARRVERPSA